MTALTLGEAAAVMLARVGSARAAPRTIRSRPRSEAPLRRDSMEAGTFEETFFATPDKGEPDRMLRAARAALDAGRRLKRLARAENRVLTSTERTIAALTAGAVRVYEEICTLARLNAGRVFPSYDWLAEATALGRATVARALGVLEAAGFLVRQRRFKRVEGEGHRYAQTSNVYRLAMPQRILDLLPRRLRPAPVSVDTVQHEAERVDAINLMAEPWTSTSLAKTVTNGTLGQVLARLSALIDRTECESQRGPGTPPNYI